VVPGKTDINQVRQYLGEPNITPELASSSFNPHEEILIWEDVLVQLNKNENIVTAIHRQPASHEKSLQFWRQHFKGKVQKFQKVQTKFYAAEHIWQLDLPNLGVNVVYDESKDEVIKVVYYAVE
tara:strand:+ start:11380 stop:11751 length:372 start_codon:yes stop_codon:yes gene_type:complete